ncbi:hypothetical protein [Streptomyces triticagri]|uniref:hypothetical protein n=1 Tax=Streptomyces triticagri TaxID=2293568 RepID=UPI00389A1E53
MKGDDPGIRRPKAVSAAAAAFTALALLVAALAACGTGGTGARDEGPAHSDTVTEASPSGSTAPSVPRVDAVALVKRDPKVSDAVKQDLKPCVADEYPVDVSYGSTTEGSSSDVVVNVMTCGDAVGIGSYVYRAEGKKYKNVFRAEDPPVYAEIDRGDLVVTKQVYDKGDPVSMPSGEEIVTYRWRDDGFVEVERRHNDYSGAVNGDSPVPEED